MKERWKSIPGFPNYMASDRGRIRSIRRKDPRGYMSGGKVLTISEVEGYYSVRVKSSSFSKYVRTAVARLVLRAFKRLPKAGEKALHWDDDQSNNVLSNLRWGNHTDNMQDAIRNGGRGKGTTVALEVGKKVSEAWAAGRYDHHFKRSKSL